MGQSNYIAAALAIAFLVYITAKGSLQTYLDILTGSGGYSSDKANAETTEESLAPAADAAEDTTSEASSNPMGDFTGIGTLLDTHSVLDSVKMFGGL